MEAVTTPKFIQRGTLLVIQWLGIHLPMQEKQVSSLVKELRPGFYATMKYKTDCMIPYMKCPELAHLEMGISCEKYLRDFRRGDEIL